MLTPLLLQMLYIYKFRQLNHVFGPQGGDTILNELLNIVINHARCYAIDSSCRYGGDKSPSSCQDLGCSSQGSQKRLTRAIKDTAFFMTNIEQDRKVTMSIGVAWIAEN
ncbi:MAG TPA: diguanylate cyclase [Nitrospirota bacterium]|nr:diguanylate cyclase [Nitrospirota bacterium]